MTKKTGRPEVVCHMMCSLNGKISGPFFRREETAALRQENLRIRGEYQCHAILNGTVTCAEIYADGYLQEPVPAPDGGRVQAVDHIARDNAPNYVICIDTEGELAWSKNTINRPGQEDAHVIEILTEKVSAGYTDYLREKGISYLFAGGEELDLSLLLQKLGEKLKIDKLMICGGGVISWAFLQAGLLDELSLLMVPAVDGEYGTASVFDGSSFVKGHRPVGFELVDTQRAGTDGLWLRYRPKKDEG